MENELLYEFKFSFATILTIVKGLQELPYKQSNAIISQINADYIKQQTEIEKAAKVKPKEEKMK